MRCPFLTMGPNGALGNFALNRKDTRIYQYSYRLLFPYQDTCRSGSPIRPTSLLSLKNVPDRLEIAYLGAMDFLDNGTKGNCGVPVRITDGNVVKEFVQEYGALFHGNLPEPDMPIGEGNCMPSGGIRV
ncbi:MAG TPA: hypothetical protein VLZ54_12045 [Arenibacter sp.]|nr:hypothetical protein [Arenibacter sp.]